MRAQRTFLTILVVALAALPGSCGVVVETQGSGTIAIEQRSVSGFTRIGVSGAGDVVIEIGDGESLTIEADDNLLALLTSEVRGDRLELGVQNLQRIRPSQTIVYRVTATDLTGIAISGSADVSVADLSSDSVDVDISGSGSVDLSGVVDGLTVSISGSGSCDGGDLVSRTGDVSISGSGSATVDVSDDLDISISGSGSVLSLGSPDALTQSVSGSGSVIER